MNARPTLALVATGGTIAGTAAQATDTRGYTAAALPAAALLAALPPTDGFARVVAEQLFELDSKDMQPAHWLALGRRVRALLADAGIDGVVITHGTDTLEETAYFLDLVVDGRKPVVLTAAMRPATALSADGPMNLWQALTVAARPDAAGLGVLVVLNDGIHDARRVRKLRGTGLDAIGSPDGPLAAVDARRLPAPSARPPVLELPAALPRVDILYLGAGADPDLMAACVERGAAGLVLALPGNASLPDSWKQALAAAPLAGLPIVFASRTGSGVNKPSPAEAARLCAGALPPLKARVRLMLGLAAGKTGAALKRWFEAD